MSEHINWKELHRKQIKKRGIDTRYPIANAGKNPNYTILKQIYIYKEYMQVRKRMKDMFPELSEFLPKRYYYMIVAERLGLSLNYINVVVAKVKRMGDEADILAERAKKRVISGEYNKTKR